VIEVLNKVDLLPADVRRSLQEQAARDPALVALSAATGEGIDRLQARLEERLGRGERVLELTLPLSDGATLAWLYAHGQVLARRDKGLKALLTVRLAPADAARLERKLGSDGGA